LGIFYLGFWWRFSHCKVTNFILVTSKLKYFHGGEKGYLVGLDRQHANMAISFCFKGFFKVMIRMVPKGVAFTAFDFRI